MTYLISVGILNGLNVFSGLDIGGLTDLVRAIVIMSEPHADLIVIWFPYSLSIDRFQLSKNNWYVDACVNEKGYLFAIKLAF